MFYFKIATMRLANFGLGKKKKKSVFHKDIESDTESNLI